MCEYLDWLENKGRSEGIQIGEIRGAIKTYNRLGYQPTQIIKQIMIDYGLKKSEAEQYMEEALQLQKV